MKRVFCLLIFLYIFLYTNAQNDPEFPRGWVMYIEAEQGASAFRGSPALYLANLQLSTQATVIPRYLRVGAVSGLSYTNKKLSSVFGPRLSMKIKTFGVGQGSLFNLQLQLEHLWGTNKQKLFGGGLLVEAIQMFSVSLTAHRDYYFHAWRFQAGAGYNLFHKKRKSPTGTDPMLPKHQ